jgi:hypothetical protein
LDIDTTGSVAAIEQACKAARKETGLEIPLGPASVYDGPYEYENRLERISLPGVKRLQIFVPEKHDWALMKIVRLIEKDIQDIKEAARTVGFDKKVLLNRFLDEMTHLVGPRKKLIENFLAMMEELYESGEADRMQDAVRKHRKWKL